MTQSMTQIQTDVLIIGAGIEGLFRRGTYAYAANGHNVTILEARGLLNGRICGQYVPSSTVPLELGPELVHGEPREIWEMIEECAN
jgi:monoamine oxidase